MKITLEKIKKIKKLEFSIPGKGVWLVTGLNGSGKTSLLAALYRIGSSYAFQRYYRTSKFENRLDSFSESKITYEINNKSVTYKYGGQRWRATPQSNSNLFNEYPYVAVKFIEANGERVEPVADDIRPRSVRSADDSIKEFLEHVLNDQKWRNLKYVNTQRGQGSQAYLIPYTSQGATYYYSEKNFSLGELCVLKLSSKLSNIEENSLVLIDEIEMALHPQAQVRLLERIQRIAKDKNLTILFSTHSATLIKNIKRKNIIFIKETNARHYESQTNVYPAQVLSEIAYDDELNADYVFLVEDKQAKILLEQMIGSYFQHCRPDIFYQPLFKIVPIGGFVQVLELLNISSQIFPSFVKKYSFLDEDVKSETLRKARAEHNQRVLDLFNQSSGKVNFLPCTPEVGLMEMIESTDARLIQELSTLFSGHHIHIDRIVQSNEYTILNGQNNRDKAKNRVKYAVNKINQTTGLDTTEIYRHLYKKYCLKKYATNFNELHQLFGPIINSR
ncbi:ATP-dependent nuclease [Tolumonas lignilytica]|uniref:ATP-dependent nuclease n=1 Tax=Tolumonas lignilytica TaxID=1283284 RepID=UPI0004635DAA|nr:AAA family ATPase [Tolumonas lignilytica]